MGSDAVKPEVAGPPAGAIPPAHIVELAVEVSGWSPCRSKRGVVIFRGADVVSHGHNYKPVGFECDGSVACKATCRTTAVHAEQQALMSAGGRPKTAGAEMLHVKSVDGKLVTSGGPSCVQCSKLALATGIAGMWLYHEDGWRRYDTADWYRQAIAAAPAGGIVAPQPQNEVSRGPLVGAEMLLIADFILALNEDRTALRLPEALDAIERFKTALADRPASPQLQKIEEDAARVEPLKAGADGQDLSQSGNELKVTAAERTDETCEHGTAWDVHCCGCHSGFLFDSRNCVCF